MYCTCDHKKAWMRLSHSDTYTPIGKKGWEEGKEKQMQPTTHCALLQLLTFINSETAWVTLDSTKAQRTPVLCTLVQAARNTISSDSTWHLSSAEHQAREWITRDSAERVRLPDLDSEMHWQRRVPVQGADLPSKELVQHLSHLPTLTDAHLPLSSKLLEWCSDLRHSGSERWWWYTCSSLMRMTSISTFYKRTVQAGGGAEHAGPRPLEPKTRDTSYKETRVRCQQVASTPTAKWSLGREGVGRQTAQVGQLRWAPRSGLNSNH